MTRTRADVIYDMRKSFKETLLEILDKRHFFMRSSNQDQIAAIAELNNMYNKEEEYQKLTIAPPRVSRKTRNRHNKGQRMMRWKDENYTN